MSGWVSVSDRLPETEQHVLTSFCARQRAGFFVPALTIDTENRSYEGDADLGPDGDSSFWPEGWYFWEDGMELYMCSAEWPTHWQPLPEPPK